VSTAPRRSTARFWDHVADLPGLSAVTDYQPTETPWARYVTALHVRALAGELQLARDARVLDHGCGVGRISDWLAPRVAEVFGVDTSAEMIAAARRRCRHANVRLCHLQGDPRALPWRDLDAAVAIWVLQHLLDAETFDATVDLLATAVRPGGDVVTLDRLCREQVEQTGSDYLCLRSRDEYAAAFTRRGLRIVAAYPVSIDEQVLGSATLTGLQHRRGWLRSLVVAADLAWARRQRDPFLADYLWHFRR
jgi:SAM-dependent methyltransferase